MYQEPPLHECVTTFLTDYLVSRHRHEETYWSPASCFHLLRPQQPERAGGAPTALVAYRRGRCLAIRDRMLYLPWEAGQDAPDFVLEMASQ